jgi:hypothetical protein
MAQQLQLTLRTLLAYLDDTLEPELARQLGAKVAESELAQQVMERIKKVTRRRGLKAPSATSDHDGVSDPNTVAEYLSNTLSSEQLTRFEEACLESDPHLAEVAACHQILTLILTEPVRVPPRARQRMYKLVPAPASAPDRQPGKARPVGGVLPAAAEWAEPDDADAPLLLGFRRYGGGSAANRLALVGAAVVLVAFLGVAVLMALPHRPPEPPATSHEFVYAGTPTPPTPEAKTPAKPEPDKEAPKPPEKDHVAVAPKPKAKEKQGELELVKRVPPPRDDRVPAGKVEGLNAIVLTRADDGPAWSRLDAADEATVTSNNQVVCLPGYKADVQLDTGVKVHLWGNVPELLPGRLLESRVKFHAPERKAEGKGEDFNADISLLAGRIYLKATKPAGAKVRLRFAGQVWDVTLPDDKSEVLAEVVTAYDPGTPFAKAGGQLPRTEVQVAVIQGSAALAVPERFKTFAKVAAPAVVTWDSKSGTLADPNQIDPKNGYYEKFFLVSSAQGTAVQKALTDMATRLKDKNGIRLMLLEILTADPDASRVVITQMAVFAQQAIVSGPMADDELKPLIDLLTDEVRGYGRWATVNALAYWIAQSPRNTALLGEQLDTKLRGDGEPEVVLRLLRGYTSPANPNPADLDQLVKYLEHPSVAIRELALWNLVNFVDPNAAKTLFADVAQAGTPGYEKFVAGWKARVQEIKNRPPDKDKK